MRGGALPAALLFLTLGLTLSFAPRRTQLVAAVVAILIATLVAFTRPLEGHVEIAFAGCWISLLLIALAIHLRPPLGDRLYLAGGALAGFWAGAVIAAEGQSSDLLRSLPFLIVAIPGGWIARRGWGIALKVASSWAMAIALFAALLPTTQVSPGYRPDHMN